MSYHWQTITKWLSEWWHGKEKRNKTQSHPFRQPGKIEEDPVSYNPGFWEATAKPFAKTLLYFTVAGAVFAGAVSGVNAGCGYKEKVDAIAEKTRVDTEKIEDCKSSIVTRKGTESLDMRCNHKDHVLRTKWERGELTIQCLCPLTLEDEKSRPATEEGSDSNQKAEPEAEPEPENQEPTGIEI